MAKLFSEDVSIEKMSPHAVTIESTLSSKTVPELKNLARSFYIKGISKFNKADLISAVGAALLVPERLEELLLVVESATWNVFREAATSNHYIVPLDVFPQYRAIEQMGYIQCYDMSDGVFVVVPEEIKALYSSMVDTGFLIRKNQCDLLHAYAEAAISLYGVISQDDFVALFNQQNERKTNIDEMFAALFKHIVVDSSYCFWDEYIVSDEFEDNDFEDVNDLLAQVGDKPRYIPIKETFLKYSDPYYYEKTVHTDNVLHYLRDTLHLDPEVADELLSELQFVCALEAPTQVVVDILDEYGVQLTEIQLKTFIPLFISMSNNTRLWSNNGHTPNELHQMMIGDARPIRRVKIGRNDPCPCGSGKKYKRCCGR